MSVELFTMSIPEPSLVEAFATRAEADGWDGITFTDSQNLVGDPFVAVAVAGRADRAPAVHDRRDEPGTRHPPRCATVGGNRAGVHRAAGSSLGIGRGDTALFHLGRKPMPVADFVARYDRAAHVSATRHRRHATGFDSRMPLARSRPTADGAARRRGVRAESDRVRGPHRRTHHVRGRCRSGAARVGDRPRARTAVAGRGPRPAEVSFGAYVTVGCHPDLDAARDSSAARSPRSRTSRDAGVDRRRPGRGRSRTRRRGRPRLRQQRAPHATRREHAQVLPDEFVDRFAVVGDVDHCIGRLRELVELGLDRFVITGPSFGAERTAAATHRQLLVDELLPAVR